ncbi:MAG: hypothetical protein EGR00_08505 [Prevotella sp.]|nr:hypothetical protein [Prevotella sp.]
MKKYMKPAIEVARIENECSIMAASNNNLGTSGLPGDDTPEFGGENSDGSVGSRKYYSIWDE